MCSGGNIINNFPLLYLKVTKLLGLSFQFGLERSWHLWWWWTRNAQTNLDTIVDEPLKTSQCTDHDNTWHQTVPHAEEAEALGHLQCR